MKKLSILGWTAAALLTCSCGAGTLGAIAGSQAGGRAVSAIGSTAVGSAVGNILTSVLGLDKVSRQDIIGTWRYSQPGCAFTSQDLLTKAGGEVAASQIRQKLLPTYQSFGLSSSNTVVTFNNDGTYTATIAGKKLSGKYTYNESNYQITMNALVVNVTCYAKRNVDGIGLLFEASKLLTLLQTLSALSGNTTVQTIGELSKSYDGLRIGFDMKK